jgi:hypothetical protein
MKIKTISLGFLIALFVCIAPSYSSAYFTTGQTDTKIGDSAAIFTIEYAFGLPEQDIYMPVIAERNLAWESSEHKLGYSIRDNENDEVTQHGKTVGIVLSSAPIVDGMYKISKDTAQKMTLVVVLSTTDTEKGSYKLQVDQLPYYVDIGEKELQVRQLNPSELTYYVTSPVTFK